MPGDRTEQATQHRRDKARKEGDILHSRELTAAAGMLAGVLALARGREAGRWWPGARCLRRFWTWGGRGTGSEPQVAGTMLALRGLALKVLEPMALVMAAVAAAALTAAVAQTGGRDGACRRGWFQAGADQPADQCEEPVFAARGCAAGQEPVAGGACWRCLRCSGSRSR